MCSKLFGGTRDNGSTKCERKISVIKTFKGAQC